MVGLLFFVQPVYADDSCDEIHTKAKAAMASAREASGQRDYVRAAELYDEAAKYYEQIANMTDSTCATVTKNAVDYVKVSRDAAAQARLAAQYRVANEKYDEGTAFAKKLQWDEAIAAFQEAAEIWERVGQATRGELGKTALESASIARDAADRALGRKNYNQAWELVKGK
jgi:tetratricopeptide (TPR) repeat protein